MIKFMSHSESGRKMLGLIITEGNIERLKEGFPIHFNAEDMKLLRLECNEVMIAYFPTEREAYEEFKKRGYINEETKIHEERKPTKQ